MVPLPWLRNLSLRFSNNTRRTDSPQVKATQKGSNNTLIQNITHNTFKQNLSPAKVTEITERKERTDISLSPTPGEIKEDIDSQPLLRAKIAGKSYIGVNIIWVLKYASAEEWTRSYYKIHLANIGEWSSPLVICKVSKKKYPWLQSLHKDEKIKVEGIISNIPSSGLIYLSKAKLERIQDS